MMAKQGQLLYCIELYMQHSFYFTEYEYKYIVMPCEAETETLIRHGLEHVLILYIMQ